MKAHTKHTTTVMSYTWLFDRFDRVQYQWFCDCGAIESNYSTEDGAAAAGAFHEATSPVTAPNLGPVAFNARGLRVPVEGEPDVYRL